MSNASLHPHPELLDDLSRIELISDDGEPLESDWHVRAMVLLISSIDQHFRDRDDYYVGGNMFIYFSEEQARNKDFRGPDFYFVWDTTREPMRPYWCLWKEGGRTPNVVIELCSPTTIKEDYGKMKEIYGSILRVDDYFCFDPESGRLDGWRLNRKKYVPLKLNKGRLWSEERGLWLGTWTGKVGRLTGTWLRFFDKEGNLVLNEQEASARRAEETQVQADEQHRRADEQQQRADAAEAELVKLREHLASAEKKSNGSATNGKGKKK